MTEEPDKGLEQNISLLFSSQKLGVLATYGPDGAYASLVGFAATDDMAGIVFATSKETKKFRNMNAAPNVALLVENSRHHPDDLTNAMAVTATGNVVELAGDARRHLADHYLKKNPDLSEFVDSKKSALMLIEVKQYVLVENFQDVKTLHF